ncbi:MAG: hypothetical protein JWP11_2815 [Frankiales bacterium]|nr:hypothetical protein [Frankiales bacterium]
MDIVRSARVQRHHLGGPPVLIELDLVTIDGDPLHFTVAAGS